MDSLNLIGDIEILRSVLDGFFKEWDGGYDILLDSGNYVFSPKSNMREYCQTVRKIPEINELCRQCDIQHSMEALEKEQVDDYICHAGLIDIAAPISIDNRCIATVLTGQGKPVEVNEIQLALEKVHHLENKFGLSLKELWNNTKSLDKSERKNLIQQTENLANYLTEVWKRQIKLENAEKALAMRVKETELIQTAFSDFDILCKTDEEFWEKMEKVIANLSEQFKATHAAVFEIKGSHGIPTLQIKVNLPDDLLNRQYPGNKDQFIELIANGRSKVLVFDYSNVNTICYDIADYLTSSDLNEDIPDELILWPINFDDDYYGVICIFSKKRNTNSSEFSIIEAQHSIEPFLGQILSSYQNKNLYQKIQGYSDLQSVWLQNVVHEVSQPINSILGYAEIWEDKLFPILEDWPDSKDDLTIDTITSLHNNLESILWMTIQSSQVARNFAWYAYGEKSVNFSDSVLSLEDDLCGVLIACARDKHGLAKHKGIFGPNVITDSFKPFDKHILIDRHLFSHAIRNILDNAVKYADKGTTISVEGFQKGSNLVIRITDYGVPILPGEENSVFERRKRTDYAQNSNITGTGIGLTIAREMLIFHKGDIKTYPSKKEFIKNKEYFKTIFDVILPLINM